MRCLATRAPESVLDADSFRRGQEWKLVPDDWRSELVPMDEYYAMGFAAAAQENMT
jgi:hypothetical protein